MDAWQQVNAELDQDPTNLQLHDQRYQQALESDDEEILRWALSDSARRVGHESYLMLIASLEENCDNFGAALEWRQLAARQSPSRQNQELLERCRESAELAEARKVLASHRLMYRNDSELVEPLDMLEQAILARDSTAMLDNLARIRQIRAGRRGLPPDSGRRSGGLR